MYWCVVDNFYFWYSVESTIVSHDGTDDLADFNDLYDDIPQEGSSFPSSHNHDCFRLQFFRIDIHGKL